MAYGRVSNAWAYRASVELREAVTSVHPGSQKIEQGATVLCSGADLGLTKGAGRGPFWLLDVPPAGIEPATHGLGNRCSIH